MKTNRVSKEDYLSKILDTPADNVLFWLIFDLKRLLYPAMSAASLMQETLKEGSDEKVPDEEKVRMLQIIEEGVTDAVTILEAYDAYTQQHKS